MKLPCCLKSTEENISYAKTLIEKEKESGRMWTLIENIGGKLEFVPTESIELIRRMMPTILVL